MDYSKLIASNQKEESISNKFTRAQMLDSVYQARGPSGPWKKLETGSDDAHVCLCIIESINSFLARDN